MLFFFPKSIVMVRFIFILLLNYIRSIVICEPIFLNLYIYLCALENEKLVDFCELSLIQFKF